MTGSLSVKDLSLNALSTFVVVDRATGRLHYNTSGAAGSAGSSGTTGSSGSSGTSGSAGSSGTSGSSGSTGTSGSSGSSGTTGSSGSAGTSGSAGSSGTSGSAGSSGTAGSSGSSGTSGSSGSSGTAGSAGSSGTAGSSGSSGTAGTSGSSGTSGTRGSSGTTGSSGSSGTTGSSGSSGTSGSAGSSGTSGSAGSAGTSGSAGSSGTAGSSGSSGTAGSSGSSGTAGTSGSSGTSGTRGSSGTSGSAGTSGVSGSPGSPGSSGTSGSAGTSGVSGSPGSPGSSGTSGSAGTSGVSGSPGSPGSSGTSGTSVSVSGTTNTVVKFTSATTIGNSSITDDGTTVQTSLPIKTTVNGALTFQGGDDSALYDINVANTLGVYGVQNSAVGAIKLGSGGPVLYGLTGYLGIGTTSPGQALDVNGRIRIGSNAQTEIYSTGNRVTFRSENTDACGEFAGYGLFLPRAGQSYNLYIAGSAVLGYSDASATLDIARGGSGSPIYIRLNSNGNSYFNGGSVGIGNTSPGHALDVTGIIRAYTNATYNGENGAIIASNATDLNKRVFIGYDGTADIGFIQSVHSGTAYKILTINAAGGNVGIGTTTPQKRLESISNANDFVSVGVQQLSVGQWTGIHFGFREANTSYRKSAIVFERTDLTEGNAQGKVHILNGPQSGGTSATLSDARITISENGNVGIGTTAPTEKLHVVGGNIKVNNGYAAYFGDSANNNGGRIYVDNTTNNFYVNQANNAPLYFATNNATKATLLGNGNFGINETSPNYKLEVYNATNDTHIAAVGGAPSLNLLNANSGPTVAGTIGLATGANNFLQNSVSGDLCILTRGSSNSAGIILFGSGSTINASIDTDGTITARGDVVAFGTPSDTSFKTNIVPIQGSLDKIQKLEPVSFTWKEETPSNKLANIKDDLGFIAQQVQEVLPELVRQNDNGTLSLRERGIIPLLVGAIKELKAEIDILKNK
jgi:hypothetical protein